MKSLEPVQQFINSDGSAIGAGIGALVASFLGVAPAIVLLLTIVLLVLRIYLRGIEIKEKSKK